MESKRAGNEIAGMGRRFLALTLDWMASWAVGSLFFAQNSRQLWIPAIFFFQVVLLTFTTGSSAGQKIFRLSVVRYPELTPIGLGATLIRTALILLVIPAVVFDRDGRGLHDRIAKSAVMRELRYF
jgi:uncharacterized RDD family membrane protein YckC